MGTAARVLVVNAGSSSLKLRMLDGDDHVVASGDEPPDDRDALQRFVSSGGAVDAVGHRVVHGGHDMVQPCRVDAEVLARLEALVPLAPLHQPAAIAGIRSLQRLLPDVPSVACFDTAFHATISTAASTYPLPREWRDRFGLRRFGFHGLSHAYAARRAGEVLGRPVHRLVTCHLGAGSSIAAVVDGRGVDTTMGFTPNEGVPMATRSGSVDVGMLTWLLDAGLPEPELADGLQHRSGLLGLAGTADMREVEAAAGAGQPDAVVAREVWLHRVTQAIAAMATSAEGIDALVFTGGIGEHSADLRGGIAERLTWLGVALDRDANGLRGDREITGIGASVRSAVIEAREDIEIARGTRAAIGSVQH
jgi:acetate kinase